MMAVLTPAFTTPRANGLGLAHDMKLLSHYTRGMTPTGAQAHLPDLVGKGRAIVCLSIACVSVI